MKIESIMRSSEDYNKSKHKFVVESLPIDQLYHPKNIGPDMKLVEKLVEDIPINGLVNPLVIHKYFRNYRDRGTDGKYLFDRRLTGAGYWGSKFQNIPYSNDTQYVVAYGNCRLEAVKQLGYEYVDCIILQDFDVKKLHEIGKMLAAYKEFGLDD